MHQMFDVWNFIVTVKAFFVKNVFYFTNKALFLLEIFKFLYFPFSLLFDFLAIAKLIEEVNWWKILKFMAS